MKDLVNACVFIVLGMLIQIVGTPETKYKVDLPEEIGEVSNTELKAIKRGDSILVEFNHWSEFQIRVIDDAYEIYKDGKLINTVPAGNSAFDSTIYNYLMP